MSQSNHQQMTLAFQEISRQNYILQANLQQLQSRLNQLEGENQVLRMRLQQSEVHPSSEVNYPAWKKQVNPEQEAYQRLASQALQTAENVLGTQQQEGEWEDYGSSCN